MATRKLNQLTLTQTKNPASALSGGVFSFDGGNFTIPNVADGVNPQDVATVNQTAPKPLNTVYVQTEDDFGPLVPTNVPGVGLVDLHQLSGLTHYVLCGQILLQNGQLLLPANSTAKISGTFEFNSLFSADINTPLSPMFFLPSATNATNLTLENLTISTVNNNQIFDINSPVLGGTIIVDGCSISAANLGQTKGTIRFQNTELLAGTTGLIIDGVGLRASNCTLTALADRVFTFINSPTLNSEDDAIQIIGNVFQVPVPPLTAFGIRIEDSAAADSAFLIANNTCLIPSDLIETGAGLLDQTDPRVQFNGNLQVRDSSAFIEVGVNNDSAVNQAIDFGNTAQKVLGFTLTESGLSITPRFTIAQSNPGMGDNITSLTYTGIEEITAEIGIYGILNGTAGDIIAIGLFKNDAPIAETYFGLAQPQTRLDTRAFQITLANNDKIELGCINKTDDSDFTITNPCIHINKIN